MSEKIIQKDGITSLGSVDREEDLKPFPGINLNPPPEDGVCNCCGRHINEVKPFGGPDDPLVGDFSGARLVKIFRPFAPYDEEAGRAFEEAKSRYKEEGFKDEFDYLIQKHGAEEGERLSGIIESYSMYGSSWECRDCIVLGEDEWFEKYDQRHGCESQT
jgi:hypothetical protein